MKPVAAALTLARSAAWRAGSDAAGRALVRTLDDADETVRMLAGMALVKEGARAAPLVREGVRDGVALPTSLVVLADVGSEEDRAVLREHADASDPEVRSAARHALELLAFRLDRA
jgi:HEAT repeat protein